MKFDKVLDLLWVSEVVQGSIVTEHKMMLLKEKYKTAKITYEPLYNDKNRQKKYWYQDEKEPFLIEIQFENYEDEAEFIMKESL